MANLSLLLLLSSFINISISSFNLIYTVPLCYTDNICDEYGEPGIETSIHPNSEERTQFLFRNIARLYPQQYINSKYGKYLLGTLGSDTEFNSDPSCGNAVPYPFYYDPQINELARYHAWDADNCLEIIGHNTCSTRCDKFADCTFKARAAKFITNGIGEDTQNGIIENTWSGNMGYRTKSHCVNAYNPSYVYQGIGNVQGSSFINTVYAKIGNGPIPYYPIIHGGHFDERDKINENDYNTDGKHLVFMVEYFGDIIGHIAVDNMYLLYDNDVYIMERIFGDEYSAFYALNFAISGTNNCKPYAFFVFTQSFDVYRLPEDENYYFSTSMIENDIGVCNINHFYYEQTYNQWFGNGSPYIDNLRDIHGVDNTKCKGCQEIDSLATKYNTIVTELQTAADTTVNPTANPTTNPTAMPSPSPSVKVTPTPTYNRFERSSSSEESSSSDDSALCCYGTNKWWNWLCKNKLYDECVKDWKCDFDDECMDEEFDNSLSPIFSSTMDYWESSESSESKSKSGWLWNWGEKSKNQRKKKKSTFSWKWQKSSSSDSIDMNAEQNGGKKDKEEKDWKNKWKWNWK